MTADATASTMDQLEVLRIELDDQGYDDNGSYREPAHHCSG